MSISRSIPKCFRVDDKLQFLAPTEDLLADWKAEKISEADYIVRYRTQIKQSWQQVKQWLDSLDPKKDLTLLCWERKGEFCHRNLVAKLVQTYRPDCFGGCDVGWVEIDKCDRCGSDLYPGLDASYCRGCKVWFSNSKKK